MDYEYKDEREDEYESVTEITSFEDSPMLPVLNELYADLQGQDGDPSAEWLATARLMVPIIECEMHETSAHWHRDLVRMIVVRGAAGLRSRIARRRDRTQPDDYSKHLTKGQKQVADEIREARRALHDLRKLGRSHEPRVESVRAGLDAWSARAREVCGQDA